MSWPDIAAKMLASAAVVALASLAVARSGPFLGAMIATLPISAGPAYVFLAVEHGAEFVARSALVSLAANAGTVCFIAIYATLAQRHAIATSLGAALALWAGWAWLAISVEWTFAGAVGLNAVAFLLSIPVHGRFARVLGTRVGAPPSSWEISWRAVAVAAVVGSAVLGGRVAGPAMAGVVALAPVVLTSLALVLHPRFGGPLTASMFANSLPGMVGFAAALSAVHAGATTLGTTAVLLLGLGISLCWNATLVILRR